MCRCNGAVGDGRTGNPGYGFFARQICDMYERIVEAREDMCDSEDELALCDLRAQRDGVFFLWYFDFLGRL